MKVNRNINAFQQTDKTMAQLTQEMKEMIGAQQCFLATVSKEGVPNNAPKRSTRVFNDETLMFSEGTGGEYLQEYTGWLTSGCCCCQQGNSRWLPVFGYPESPDRRGNL